MSKKLLRILSLLLSLLLLLSLCGCGSARTAEKYSTWEDFDGATFAATTGTVFAEILTASGYFDDCKLKWAYFPSPTDGALAVINGKVDAVGLDLPVAEMICAEYPELSIYKDYVAEDHYGYLLQKNSAYTQSINELLEKFRADGTLQLLHNKWVTGAEEEKIISLEPWDESGGVLRYGTGGTAAPMCYVKDGQTVGYEVELAYLIARELHMSLEISINDFSGLISGVGAGIYDMASGCISITEERRESMDMTESIYDGAVAIVYLNGRASEEENTPFNTWTDFDGATFAVTNGSAFPEMFENSSYFDGCELKWSYYPAQTDGAMAVINKKVDAAVQDLPLAEMICAAYPDLSIYKDYVAEDHYGYLLPKNSTYTDKINALLEKYREDGTLQALHDKWVTGAEEGKVLDLEPWDTSEGTLHYGTGGTSAPMCYVKDGQTVGYEVELTYCIARDLHMDLEISINDFSGLISGIGANKYDIASSCFSITEERKQSMDMTESIYDGAVAIIYYGGAAREKGASLRNAVTSIKSSFEKTFLREERWKLFIEGILNTLEITILSMALGTLLGFVLYFLCKRGGRIATSLTRFCIWLVQGMPMVVLLMVLYYIVLGKSNLSGVWVSVIGFTLTFGASMEQMLEGGVKAVDEGQLEASLALGYSQSRAFFRIILPQAALHFLPSYRVEVTQHIKATAIVGYIAVQDLTKMSDIVRSRTYEAFFPLIATAVLYFVLAGILKIGVNFFIRRCNPKSRSVNKILKGVNRNDRA